MVQVRPDWKPVKAEPKEPKPLKKTRGFRTSPAYLREQFRFDVIHATGGRCLMADISACDERTDADGNVLLDPAHIIPKSVLRKRGLPESVIFDARDGMPLCRRHHRRSDSGLERVPRELLPPAVHEFAAELGLTHLVDRLYPERTR